MTLIKRRGMLFVLSSPSGAGKTTIAKRLLEEDPQITKSISVTTRHPRLGEVEGQDYYFVDDQTFDQLIKEDQFLEYAGIYGARYGTPRGKVEETLKEGKDIIFAIEWQGKEKIAKAARADLVSVFILPPSYEELERRLISRSQGSQGQREGVERRLREAVDDFKKWQAYDYVVINQDLEETVEGVKTILKAARLERIRQIGLEEFVETLTR